MTKKEPEEMLQILLSDMVVFINDHWWMKEEGWTEEQTRLFSINVNCNDVFAWASADAVELMFDELESLYEHYEVDKVWGPVVWCIKKEKLMPQKPVYDSLQKSVGHIWNLDEMELKPNTSWSTT